MQARIILSFSSIYSCRLSAFEEQVLYRAPFLQILYFHGSLDYILKYIRLNKRVPETKKLPSYPPLLSLISSVGIVEPSACLDILIRISETPAFFRNVTNLFADRLKVSSASVSLWNSALNIPFPCILPTDPFLADEI